MCTVPMATTIADCEKICQLVDDTGLKYMMAETVVYSREFLFIKQLYELGEFGRIQYMQASHPQDMDGWPEYWKRMIPMHYATHVVSPVLGLVDGRAECVSCFGSGSVREEIRALSGNSFAVESCHIKIADSDISAHIWRFLYDTARQYRESFDVYGSKKSFEWSLVEGKSHTIHTAKRPEPEIPEKVTVPDFAHLLPEEIRPFTQSIVDADHLSFLQGSGHGGSHPHLVHEFVPRPGRAGRPLAERPYQRKLDVCRHLGSRIGAQRGSDTSPPRIHSNDLVRRWQTGPCRTLERAPDCCDWIDKRWGRSNA